MSSEKLELQPGACANHALAGNEENVDEENPSSSHSQPAGMGDS
jgi:hypothetical protein